MRHSLLSLLMALSLPLSASTYTWTGAASNKTSDPSNWNGGSPVGDPDADLVFPNDSDTERNVINDVPGLRFKTLTTMSSYVISGAPLATKDGVIRVTNGDATIWSDIAFD